MARVTVEDCLKNTTNRFDLTIDAATRARAIELGMDDALVPLDNDKPTVLALREIAEGYEFDAEGRLPGSDEEVEEEGGESGGSNGYPGGLLGGSILPGF